MDTLSKYYFIDTGLRNARLNFAYSDDVKLLENVIYNDYSVNVRTFDTGKKILKINL